LQSYRVVKTEFLVCFRLNSGAAHRVMTRLPLVAWLPSLSHLTTWSHEQSRNTLWYCTSEYIGWQGATASAPKMDEVVCAPKKFRRKGAKPILQATCIPTPSHLTPKSRHRQSICQRLFKFQIPFPRFRLDLALSSRKAVAID